MNIFKLYNEVFDENGNNRLTGRDKCKKLIDLCQSVNPTIDFGNKETGMTNPDNIRNFIKMLYKATRED